MARHREVTFPNAERRNPVRYRVTKGRGDYLNLADHAWSPSSFHASADERAMTCVYPGPEGTLVIDDATGAILGVYPGSPIAPHPSP